MRFALLPAVCALVCPLAALSGPGYRIIVDLRDEAVRAVDVRVDRPLDEAGVRAVAQEIVEREAEAFQRTTVNFHLPAARSDEAPWASATLIRHMQVNMRGASLFEAPQQDWKPSTDGRSVIGMWLLAATRTTGHLTIFVRNAQLHLELLQAGGTRTEWPLEELPVPQGRRFDIVGRADFSHVLINKAGALELRSENALRAVAERIVADRLERTVSKAGGRTDVSGWPAKGNQSAPDPAPAGDGPTPLPGAMGLGVQLDGQDSGDTRGASSKPTEPPTSRSAPRRAQPPRQPGIDVQKLFFNNG